MVGPTSVYSQNPIDQSLKSKVKSTSISQSYDIDTSSIPDEEKHFEQKYGSVSVIADKGLRKFYEHLDQVNKQEVTAFQMYNRVREQFKS